MRAMPLFACLALTVGMTARSLPAQTPESPEPAVRPWWAGLSMGYGRVSMTSNQGRDLSKGVLTMAFRGGRALGQHLRLGVELGGWLLESGDVWDPSRGESLSATSLVAQFLPTAGGPLVIEAAVGLATYQDNRPLEFGSRGTGWSAGAGYERRWRSAWRVVPSVHVSGGSLRDIRNALVTETGLRYAAWDLRLGVDRHFGRPRE